MTATSYADEVLGDLPDATVRTVRFENAARLYRGDLADEVRTQSEEPT